ncbi:MAG: hypothetical protein WAK33_17485 [Silvibacterium sp.]
MRRALAISLMLLFCLPLVLPLFRPGMAEATLPACCRRGGRHQCAVPTEGATQGSDVRVVSDKCPYAPATAAVLLLPSFTPSTAASIFAGVTRHPAVSPQTETQLRISFDRTRQKRGPPALLA